MPTDWEVSIALAGEVGEFVVFAREERGGGDWYVGAISGEQATEIEVPLSFLDEDKRYVATIYRDGDEADWKSNPYDYVIERRSLTGKQSLGLRLAPGGGAAIRLQPDQQARQ